MYIYIIDYKYTYHVHTLQYTLPKTNITPAGRPGPKKANSSEPTPAFQVLCSFQGGHMFTNLRSGMVGIRGSIVQL